MKALILTVLLAALLPAGPAGAAKTGDAEYATPAPAQILTTDLSGGDLLFFSGAARETALLTLLSGMAKTRATTPEVQSVANTVWKEQSAAAARLEDLAALKHIPISPGPGVEGKKRLETVEKFKGLRFDKACLDLLGDTQDALETSLEAGLSSTDKDIKAYAETVEATLRQERDRIRKLGM